MTTAQLARRVAALEIVKQPVLLIDAVVIGGAAVDGKVIVIGGNWIPNHDNQPG